MTKSKSKTDLGKREPISENIGAYLFNLRVIKNISREELAKHLNVSIFTIRNIENNEMPIPAMRLRLWLDFLDALDHYDQLNSILRQRKIKRTFNYEVGNKANEHIDRLIDAYENNHLTHDDILLLRMIAPYEYNQNKIDTTPTPDTKPLDVSSPTRRNKSKSKNDPVTHVPIQPKRKSRNARTSN